jgi:TPR repeat protein
MFDLGALLDQGKGVAAPDSSAAAEWYRRAADGGFAAAANNLSNMYLVGRGRAWLIMHATSFFHISGSRFEKEIERCVRVYEEAPGFRLGPCSRSFSYKWRHMTLRAVSAGP